MHSRCCLRVLDQWRAATRRQRLPRPCTRTDHRCHHRRAAWLLCRSGGLASIATGPEAGVPASRRPVLQECYTSELCDSHRHGHRWPDRATFVAIVASFGRALPCGAMRTPLWHKMVGFFCLICFGLGGIVLNGGLVLCQHADGSSCIEWSGCSHDEDGSCVSTCDGAASTDDGQPIPCEDTPLKAHNQLAKACPRPARAAALPPVLVVAVACLPLADAAPLPVAGRATRHARPPDVLTRLRTVVLVV